jgi:hypothetical protein
MFPLGTGQMAIDIKPREFVVVPAAHTRWPLATRAQQPDRVSDQWHIILGGPSRIKDHGERSSGRVQ